jgi:hypothetical protein
VKRLAVVTATAAALVAAAAPGAFAAGRTDAWNLHPGSRGPRVVALQWMLAGHCPNRYAPRCGGKVKPTLRRYTKGVDGARTSSGAVALKYRLGYPKAGECGASRSYLSSSVGPYFFALLKGQKQRPTCWVVLAAKRVKLPAPGISASASKVKAFEVAQLGVLEQPLGSNRGPRISFDADGVRAYQAATGAFAAAWCVSFQQAAFLRALGLAERESEGRRAGRVPRLPGPHGLRLENHGCRLLEHRRQPGQRRPRGLPLLRFTPLRLHCNPRRRVSR